MAPTPNLDELRRRLRDLVAGGCEWPKAEDRFLASSDRNMQVYQQALIEFSRMPRVVTDGCITFRSGTQSNGRRSVQGFRSFISDGALS
jgi:hypothetical protein